jgi:multiple sugar transport system substrate-binding protein
MAYATWITSAPVQTNLYFEAGGQPGRAEAWVDDGVNARSGDFFRRTLATMEGAWVRPRIQGYQRFQGSASAIVADWVTGGASAGATLDDLDELWRSTERAAAG